jgi:hypothetical protein
VSSATEYNMGPRQMFLRCGDVVYPARTQSAAGLLLATPKSIAPYVDWDPSEPLRLYSTSQPLEKPHVQLWRWKDLPECKDVHLEKLSLNDELYRRCSDRLVFFDELQPDDPATYPFPQHMPDGDYILTIYAKYRWHETEVVEDAYILGLRVQGAKGR